MKPAHKITLGTVGTIVAITAGLFTIIEKTPSVINVISAAIEREPAQVPDTVQVTKGYAGNANIQYENVQNKPMRGK